MYGVVVVVEVVVVVVVVVVVAVVGLQLYPRQGRGVVGYGVLGLVPYAGLLSRVNGN